MSYLESVIADLISDARALSEKEIEAFAPANVLAPGAMVIQDLGPITDPHFRGMMALASRLDKKLRDLRFSNLTTPKECAEYIQTNQAVQIITLLCGQRLMHLANLAEPSTKNMMNIQRHVLRGWKLVILAKGPGIIPMTMAGPSTAPVPVGDPPQETRH